MVAMNPMARWPTKLWEPRFFAMLADRLEGEGLCVVFTGAQPDGPALDEIGRFMTVRQRRLEGKTSLNTLAALYRRAQAFEALGRRDAAVNQLQALIKAYPNSLEASRAQRQLIEWQ